MAVVKLVVDKPVPGALKFSKGKFGESKFPGGDYYMFTLLSGDVMFLEEKICDEPDGLFSAKGIGKGDPFVITLRKTKSGGKFYEVLKLSEGAEPESEPELDPRRYPDASGTFESKLERDLASSLAQAQQQRKAVTPSKSATPPAAAVTTNTDSQKSSTAPDNHNPIAIVPSPNRPRAGSLMASALVAAVDACIIAQEYAESKGLAWKFDAERCQAIACTLYIQHHKDPQYAQRVGGPR